MSARTSSPCLRALAAALALAAWGFPREAGAVEREWQAGADFGLSFLGTSMGPGAGGHLTYGLSDAFNALLEIDGSRQGFGADPPRTTVLSAGLGAAYTLDITQWVPYFGVLLGGYRVTGDVETTAPGFQFALGLDYRIERHWGLGVEVRYHTILAADPIGSQSYTTTFLRGEYSWGF